MRVVLRVPNGSDQDEFMTLRRVSRVLHTPWEPIRPQNGDPFGDAAWSRFMAGGDAENCERRLVCRADTGAIVGLINVNNIVRGVFQNGALGYWIGQPFAGQGYMTAGLQEVLRVGFDELGLHRLEANIIPHNEPSKRLVERCGFRLEGLSLRYLKIAGEWQDHERWAITAEEWAPVN